MSIKLRFQDWLFDDCVVGEILGAIAIAAIAVLVESHTAYVRAARDLHLDAEIRELLKDN